MSSTTAEDEEHSLEGDAQFEPKVDDDALLEPDRDKADFYASERSDASGSGACDILHELKGSCTAALWLRMFLMSVQRALRCHHSQLEEQPSRASAATSTPLAW